MSKFENTSDQQPQNTNVQQEPFKNLDDLIRNHWPSGTHEGGGALNEELRQTIKTSLEDAKAIAKARIIPLELPHHRCLCFHLYNMVTDMERRANGRFTDFVNLERKAEREGNNAMKNHGEEWGRWWNEHRSKLNQVLKDIETHKLRTLRTPVSDALASDGALLDIPASSGPAGNSADAGPLSAAEKFVKIERGKIAEPGRCLRDMGLVHNLLGVLCCIIERSSKQYKQFPMHPPDILFSSLALVPLGEDTSLILTVLIDVIQITEIAQRVVCRLTSSFSSRRWGYRDLNGAVAPTSTQIYGSLENGDKIKTSSEKEKEKNSNATDEGG
ncbi:hypothetical protein D9758_013763 [Tetrapyrgos nigripes]|uniref:Uncharacterized protein n=1 Tax=Tetrapyrgos nigripes TaxID=182062 RepID=A0A8H5D4R5_9AGAR|nr:hypothetical protein D9758_013763 [Tetrapyrgos nigripes]